MRLYVPKNILLYLNKFFLFIFLNTMLFVIMKTCFNPKIQYLKHINQYANVFIKSVHHWNFENYKRYDVG